MTLAHLAVRRAPGDRLTDYVALLGVRIVDEILSVTGIIAEGTATDSGCGSGGSGYAR